MILPRNPGFADRRYIRVIDLLADGLVLRVMRCPTGPLNAALG
jgi:hypothetical protein